MVFVYEPQGFFTKLRLAKNSLDYGLYFIEKLYKIEAIGETIYYELEFRKIASTVAFIFAHFLRQNRGTL